LRQAYDYWQDQPGNYFPNHQILGGSCATFLGQEFISLIQKISLNLSVEKDVPPHDQEIEKTALFPDLTSFRCIASCCFSATKITPFRENYLQSAMQKC